MNRRIYEDLSGVALLMAEKELHRYLEGDHASAIDYLGSREFKRWFTNQPEIILVYLKRGKYEEAVQSLTLRPRKEINLVKFDKESFTKHCINCGELFCTTSSKQLLCPDCAILLNSARGAERRRLLKEKKAHQSFDW